jgi:hypothetical protein
MKKMLGVVEVLVVVTMVCALTGSSEAKDRTELSTMLQTTQDYLRIFEMPGEFSAQQLALFEYVFPEATLRTGDRAGIPGTDRLARPSYGYLYVSDTCYVWDGGQWVYSSRTTYTYGTNQLMTTIVTEEWDGGQWVNVSKNLFSYDGSSRMINSTYQEWDGGQWVNVSDYTITYDGSGNSVEMLMREWEGGAWVNSVRITSTFSGNLVQTSLTQYWADPVWENSLQVTYSYDGNNRAIEEVTQFWFGSSWTNLSRRTHAYNGSGQVTETINQSWLAVNWSNQSRTTYAYNGNGQETTVTQYSWAGAAWVESSMWQYTYNGSGYEILAVYSSWSGSSWVETEADTSKYSGDKLVEEVRNHIQSAQVDRTQYTWDGDCMVADLDQVWQDGAWVNETRCVYVCGTGSGILSESEQKPVAHSLAQNYPNPFNASTVIRYSLDRGSPVTITVYNLLGQTVTVLDEAYRAAGVHETTWDGADRSGHAAPSGLYFYRLAAGEFNEVHKMVLMK